MNRDRDRLSKEYRILKRKLDVPDEFMPILVKLISNEESQILVLITERSLTASAIARKLGEKDTKRISSVFERLYQDSFLHKKATRGETAYKSRGFHNIISSLLQEKRYETLGLENLHALRRYYLSARIRITERALNDGQLDYSSKIIPIGKAISVTQYILPTQQAIEFLRGARVIALTKCGCRNAFGNCKNPLDTCLLLDEEAEYLISRGYARRVSLEEAKKVLEVANKTGLVHLALYVPDQKAYAICSCCPCCCHDLQALLKYGKKLFVAKSDYIAACDTDLCTGCGVCVERCIFGAREMQGMRSIVKEENCYGCGLCVTTCPTKASKLIPRKQDSSMTKRSENVDGS